MSAEFPTLAEVLLRADMNHPTYGTTEFADYQADMWREACTIRTVEQLGALKTDPAECEGPIIKGADGDIHELNDDGSWCEMGSNRRKSPTLPALLIWHPDWSKP